MKLGISLSAITLFSMLVLSAFSGCDKQKSMTDVYSTNIKKMHGCYTLYLEEHGYKGPENEEQFKEYLKTDPTAIHLLKRIDVTPDTVDDIFVGDRDGKPFVVRYGLNGVADHACIFEAEGLEGKRLIALADPIEVDKETYDDYLSGKIKPETEAGSQYEDEEAGDDIVTDDADGGGQ